MVEPVPARVLDSTTGIAGAYGALLLHQAGADVVRAARDGDDPQLPIGSPLYRYLRQGQAVVQLDGASPGDAGADIWLATPTPDERDDLNDVAAQQPGLVIVAITPYGLEGPYRDRPASDLTLQADSGALAVRGQAGEEPIQMGGRTVEWLAGAFAAATALAQWRGRRAGGPGAVVDISLAEVANVGAANFMDVFHAIEPGVDAEPSTPPRLYETPSIEKTSDGWVGFNTNAPHQIDGFLRMMGRDDLADSGEWSYSGTRISRIAEWQPLVTAWTSARTSDEIIEAALAHNVPVAPVCDGRAVVQLDHVVERESLIAEPGGQFRMPRRAWRIDNDRGPDPEPAADPADAPHGLPHWTERRTEIPGAGTATPVGKPLTGLRVLDLTAWWAGPSATALLAAFGADVIHVEGPGRMDGMRMVGLTFSGKEEWWERSPFFMTINVNKRDLVLDITSPRGREVVLDLIKQVDVVVENFTPRVLDKLDLAWDAVHAANPHAIQVRMPAFGLDGPWRERPGFAQNIEQATEPGLGDGPRRRPAAHPARPVRSERRAARGHRPACRARHPRPHGRGEPGRGVAVRRRASARVGSDHRVDRERERARARRQPQRARRTSGRLPVRRAGCMARGVGPDGRRVAGARRRDRSNGPGRGSGVGHPRRPSRRARPDRRSAQCVGSGAGPCERGRAARCRRVSRPRRRAIHASRFATRSSRRVASTRSSTNRSTGSLPIPTQPFRVRGVDEWVRSPAPQFGQHTDEVLIELLGLSDAALADLRADGTIADRPVGM